MGRKLRFDVRKNYERKAKQQTRSLLVRLPLEVYTKRILTNLNELHRRLHQFSLPPEWEYMTTYRDEKLEVMTIRKAALAIKVQENLNGRYWYKTSSFHNNVVNYLMIIQLGLIISM